MSFFVENLKKITSSVPQSNILTFLFVCDNILITTLTFSMLFLKGGYLLAHSLIKTSKDIIQVELYPIAFTNSFGVYVSEKEVW